MNQDKKNNDIMRQLREMQVGGYKGPVQTAFQSYLKNVPGATPSDTTGGNNDTRFVYDSNSSRTPKGQALQKAYTATYGDYVADVDNRVPQNKASVKAYTKSIRKTGGSVGKSKKK